MSTGSGITKATQDTYDVPEVLADARIDALPAGTNLLIAGPTRTKKQVLALDVLAADDGVNQPAILVSTDTSANKLLEQFQTALDGDLPRTYVVDCTGNTDTAALPSGVHVEEVSSAGDLTGIGVGVAKSMQAIGDDAADGLRLAHISLSTLLQYTDENRVFEFCHVVSGRIAAANYLGVWTLSTDAHDPTTVNTLRGRFEYVAEIREADDGHRDMRVLGGPDEWRQWKAL